MFNYSKYNINLLLVLVFSTFYACVYTEKIQTGDVAIQRKQYNVAVELLEKEYIKTNVASLKALKAYQLGISYDKMGQFKESVQWFEEAVRYDHGPDAIYSLANGYKKVGKYNEAMNLLNEYAKLTRDNIRVSAEISSTQQAMNWVIEERENKIFNISKIDISEPNSSEFINAIDKQGNIYYTSDKTNEGQELYKWTGRSYSQIYMKSNEDDVSLGSPFNSQLNSGTVTFSPKGDECVFSRCDVQENNDYFCKLYYTRKEGDGWIEPVLLNFTESEVNYVQPAFNSDASILAFSSDKNKDEKGYDIFITKRRGVLWTEPEDVGNVINSSANEGFPQYKGDTLFFSSDRSAGMGGLDIYYTYIMDDGRLSPPVNMKYPINSPADDFGLILLKGNDSNNWTGYFSSNRDGSDDIFFFERDQIRENKIIRERQLKDMNYFVQLTLVTEEKEYIEKGNTLSGVKFKKPLANVEIDVYKSGEYVRRSKTNQYGFFDFKPNWEKDYTFIFTKDNYLTNSIDFSTKNITIDSTKEMQLFQRNVLMEEIFIGQEIVLESIYYDYDKWDIREDARPSLDTLVSLMRFNPKLTIELSSHTDCRGEDQYNKDLSQKRAESAIAYLILNGVKSERVVAKGYGETLPAVDCACDTCTEEEHQRNRRTSFMITGGVD